MKKHHMRLLIMLTALLIPAFLAAQKTVIVEDFEKGMPDEWSEENGERWSILPEANNNQNHVAFYTSTSTAKGTKTRLVTKEIEIDTRVIQNPILVFDYQIDENLLGEIDTLRVYNKLKGHDDQWEPFENGKGIYRNATRVWVSDTLIISTPGNDVYTFQFAFEGSTGNGVGISLDNISVGATPVCGEISNPNVSNITYNSATLTWNLTKDDATIYVKVSKDVINNPVPSENDSLPKELGKLSLNNLESHTLYYYYIFGDCGDGDVTKWISGTFKTACDNIESIEDFAESFESYTTMIDRGVFEDPRYDYGDFKDGCWTISALTTDPVSLEIGEADYPYAVSSNACDGSQSLRLSGKYSATAAKVDYTSSYAATKRISEAIDLTTKQLTFCMTGGAKNQELHVGFSDSPDNIEAFELLQVFKVQSANAVERKVLHLNQYTGNKRYLVFHVSGANNSMTTTIYIDNLKLEPLSACESLKISKTQVTDIAGTTANISWNAVNSTSWNLKVSSKSINPAVEKGNIYDNSATNPQSITGLTAGNVYFYYIQPICGTVKGEWSEENYFITACASPVTSFPYTESFDNWLHIKDPQNSFISCWKTAPAFNSGSISLSTQYTISKPASLALNSGTETTIAITPEMGDALHTLEIKFSAAIHYTATLTVGVIKADGSYADLLEVGKFTVNTDDNLKFKNYTISLDQLLQESNYNPAIHKHIAFSSIANAYVDDLVIQKIKTCPIPTNVQSTSKTTSSVSLKWDANTAESWRVIYGMEGFNPANSGKSKTVFSNTTNITGLESNTRYDFYVEATCTASGSSNLGGPLTVLTAQTPAILNYANDFEDTSTEENKNWTLLNGTYPNKWYISSGRKYEGDMSLYVSMDGQSANYTNTPDLSLIYAFRTINIPQAGLHKINFKWQCRGESNKDYMRVFLVPEEIEISAIDMGITSTNTPKGWLSVSESLWNSSDWTDFEKIVAVDKAGKYNLVFFWTNDRIINTNHAPAAAVDNLSVEAYTGCYKPLYESIAYVHDTSAQLSFSAYNTTGWNLIVSKTAISDFGNIPGDAKTHNLTSKTFVIPDLEPSTHYYYYLKSDCETTWNVKGEFTTRCERETLPYEENFNSYSGIEMPPCWTRLYNSQYNTRWPKLGSGTLNLSGCSGNEYGLVASPMLGVNSFNGLKLSFSLNNPGEKASTVIIGFMTDADDLDSFYEVETLTLKPKTKEEFIKELGKYNYTDEGKYIAFLKKNDNLTTVAIDDIVLEEIPTCYNPYSYEEADITAESVLLKWDGGDIQSFNIKVSTKPITDLNETADIRDEVVNAHSLAIDELRFNTPYYWRIKAICTDGKEVEWSKERSFRTQCLDDAAVPMKEDFESYASEVFPYCWNLLAGRSYATSNNTRNGIRSFLMRSDALIASPKLAVNQVKDLTVEFYRYSIAAGTILTVGVISDLNDVNSFEKIEEFTFETAKVYEFTTVDLSAYMGTGKYIAFKQGGNTIYIDDLTIRYTNPTCGTIDYVYLSEITDNTATIRWNPIGSIKTYELKVSSYLLDAQREEGNVDNITNISGLSKTIEGLTADQTYYVYVREVCGTNDKGAWSEPIQIRTTCAATGFPFVEKFNTHGGTGENYFPDCWRLFKQQYNTNANSTSYITNDGAGDAASLYMHAQYSTDDTNGDGYTDILAVTPPLQTNDIQKCQIKFKYKSTNYGTNAVLQVGVMENLSSSDKFTLVETFYTKGTTAWSETQLINFSNYDVEGKSIGFRIDGSLVGETYQIQIDDIEIDLIPVCAAPNKIANNVNTSSTLGFTWEKGNESETQWQYVLSKKKIKIDENTTIADLKADAIKEEVVTTTSCLINTGIDANTTYYFYIASVCGAIYPNAFEVKTACEPIAPVYMQDFTGFGSGSKYFTPFPDCWYRMNDIPDATSYPYIHSIAGKTALRCLTDDGYSIAITPEINADIKEISIQFNAIKTNNSNNTLHIGIMENPQDLSTFQSIYVIDPAKLPENNHWTDFKNITFESYDGNGKYIAFYAKDGETCDISITDIIITEKMDCFIPEGINILSRTSSSFSIKWDNRVVHSSWEVKYGAPGFNPETEGTSATVNAATFSAESLPANTQYDVYIRNICGQSAPSEWSEKIMVSTSQINLKDIPFCIDFEDSTEDSDWTLANGSEANSWVIGTAVSSTPGTRSLYISDNGTANQYDVTKSSYVFAYRTVNVPTGSYDISFNWKSKGESADYLRAFLVPENVPLTPGSNNGITETNTPAGWYNIANALYGQENWTEQKIENLIITNENEGRYNLVFYWKNNDENGEQPAVAIDNVCFDKSACTTPQNLTASAVKATSATLNWFNYNSESWKLRIYENEVDVSAVETNTSYILDTIVDKIPVTINYKLKPSTTYYYYVNGNCTEQNNIWVKGSFTTLCQIDIPHTENFDYEHGSYMSCWTKLGNNESPFISMTSRWNGIGGLVIRGTADQYSIAITPEINVGDINEVQVKFMGKPGTGSVSQLIVGVIENDKDYNTFFPITTVSGSDGWTEHQIFIQGYKGMGKQIAFLVPEGGESFTIDNLRIGCLESEIITDETCPGKDYNKNGFSFTREELKDPGVYIKTREIPSSTECDSVITLSLTVLETLIGNVYAHVCEGETYPLDGFSPIPGEPGKYQKATPHSSGCDSITYLHLNTIIPEIKPEAAVSACDKELPYTWHNKELAKDGTYRDTVPSVINGCDSIIWTVDFKVLLPSQRDTSLTLTESQLPYPFENGTIPEGLEVGIEHKLAFTYPNGSANGCDSIINLTVTINKDLTGLTTVNEKTFYLAPNPVKLGSPVYVHYDFSAEEREGLRVEIFNSAGVRINSKRPEQYPINVGDYIDKTGLYMIRITTGKNDVMTTKLIVH